MTVHNMLFLKDASDNPDFIIGDYSYYSLENEQENFFEDNILYYHKNHGKLQIGKFCSLANGVQFIMGAANHSIASFSSYPFNMVKEDWRDKLGMTAADMPQKGDTQVGHDVWIGRDATIMPGVQIGNGAVIGAKAVVAKDIPPYAVAVGNPAQIIKYRFDSETIAFLSELEWWDFTEAQLEAAIPYLTSLDLESSKAALQQIKQTSPA